MNLFPRRTIDGITTDRTFRAVLVVLLTDAANLGGSTIWRLSRIRSSGHVHRCLTHLEANGWVSTTRETTPLADRGARTFYRLTLDGRAQALQLCGLTDADVDDDAPTDVLPPTTAPCGIQRCSEHDRATLLEARLAQFQEASMAADWGSR